MQIEKNTQLLYNVGSGSDDIAEDRTPPGPGAVSDNVSRVGDEWSVVGVELAHLVTGTVVVRVAGR